VVSVYRSNEKPRSLTIFDVRPAALKPGDFHMPIAKRNGARRLNLTVGEIVQVRSAVEILATLDENGELDALPFMFEMLQYCGKQFSVFKRAAKTCDTVNWTGNRTLADTVHLAELRCDGTAHGGCQAGCLLFWKEAWLRRPARDSQAPASELSSPRMTLEILRQRTRKHLDPCSPDEDVYSCQATELPRFTKPLSPWNLSQYLRDWTCGNVKASSMLRSLGIWFFNILQRIRKGAPYPMYFRTTVRGPLQKTPRETLDLKPGELVRIKERDEILATLDGRERNRGLYFDPEMVRFCGGEYRVLRRVQKIINEKTGKMMKMPNDCIVLEGVACVGELHGFCPRSIYPYWREIWLRRAE
jgi:hypothetical protein